MSDTFVEKPFFPPLTTHALARLLLEQPDVQAYVDFTSEDGDESYYKPVTKLYPIALPTIHSTAVVIV